MKVGEVQLVGQVHDRWHDYVLQEWRRVEAED